MTELDLAIQVVNYNTRGYLEICLDGVGNDLANHPLNWRVLILDNGSTDDLSGLQERYLSDPRFEFHYSPRNLGFAAAHNRLSGLSDSSQILILNPDVEFIQPNTVVRLRDRLKGDTKVVGPTLRTPSGETQHWDHGKTLLGNPGFLYWRQRKNPLYVAWVSGACMMIDRGTFEEVGKFDENYFMYKEEEDLCYLISKKGGRILYDPTIELKHYGRVVGDQSVYMPSSLRHFIEKYKKDIGFLGYWANRAWIKFVNKY